MKSALAARQADKSTPVCPCSGTVEGHTVGEGRAADDDSLVGETELSAVTVVIGSIMSANCSLHATYSSASCAISISVVRMGMKKAAKPARNRVTARARSGAPLYFFRFL